VFENLKHLFFFIIINLFFFIIKQAIAEQHSIVTKKIVNNGSIYNDHYYSTQYFNQKIKNETVNHDDNQMEDQTCYSLRQRNRNSSYFFGFETSKSSFEDVDDDYNSEQTYQDTDDNEEINENCRAHWTEDESIRLIYILDRVGHKWSTIANLYKEHFKGRDHTQLLKKYQYLRKFNLIEDLRKKAHLINDVKIINKTYKREPLPWSPKELTYLVLGVMRFGTKWETIRKVYKSHFQKGRLRNEYQLKYMYLKKFPNKLQFYQKQAELLKINKKILFEKFRKI
jgi:hypothetical protein